MSRIATATLRILLLTGLAMFGLQMSVAKTVGPTDGSGDRKSVDKSGTPDGKRVRKEGTSTEPLDPTKVSRDEAGARKILEQFLKPGADYEKLTKSLRPRRGHYHVHFSPRIAQRMYWIYSIDWNRGHILIKPKRGQKGLVIKSATVGDLIKHRGLNDFPSGYHWVLRDMRPSHRIYVFTFTKPGENVGRTYAGLVHVRDQWVYFPRPWEALQRSRKLRLAPDLNDPRNWRRPSDKKKL